MRLTSILVSSVLVREGGVRDGGYCAHMFLASLPVVCVYAACNPSGWQAGGQGNLAFPFVVRSTATTSCVRVVQCQQLQPSARLGARPADSTRPYAGAWPAWTTSTSMVRMTRTMTSATGSARCSARRLSITGWHRLCGQPELRRLLPAPRRTFGCARPCPASATQPR